MVELHQLNAQLLMQIQSKWLFFDVLNKRMLPVGKSNSQDEDFFCVRSVVIITNTWLHYICGTPRKKAVNLKCVLQWQNQYLRCKYRGFLHQHNSSSHVTSCALSCVPCLSVHFILCPLGLMFAAHSDCWAPSIFSKDAILSYYSTCFH